jgi:hypothetical protein
MVDVIEILGLLVGAYGLSELITHLVGKREPKPGKGCDEQYPLEEEQ